MTLLHQDYHIPLIRRFEKTVTRRVWKARYNRPKSGSVHMAVSKAMNPDKYPFVPEEDCDCFVGVGHIEDEPLGAMTDADAQREGDYETVAEFRVGWERIHGEGSWDPEQVVAVVPYIYLGRERPEDPELHIRFCPECDTLMEPVADVLRCRDRDCQWFAVPCECGGWFTESVGVEDGDSVARCPDCGQKFFAPLPAGHPASRGGGRTVHGP